MQCNYIIIIRNEGLNYIGMVFDLFLQHSCFIKKTRGCNLININKKFFDYLKMLNITCLWKLRTKTTEWIKHRENQICLYFSIEFSFFFY